MSRLTSLTHPHRVLAREASSAYRRHWPPVHQLCRRMACGRDTSRSRQRRHDLRVMPRGAPGTAPRCSRILSVFDSRWHLAHSEHMSLSDSWTARPAAINRQNAAEAVFEDLRGAIESGELSIGTRLPSEAALAERYGVSRPIVREALRSAQTLGLTQTRTGSGTFVIATAPSPEITYGAYSARDLMEARPVIEVPAAGWAARRRTDEQLRVLTELCAEMKREKDPDKWVSLDSRFHCVIAEASDNAVFIRVVLDARDALATQSQLINLVAHRRPASNREHQRIVDAIASGSFEDSQEAMRDHLARVARAMSKISKPDS